MPTFLTLTLVLFSASAVLPLAVVALFPETGLLPALGLAVTAALCGAIWLSARLSAAVSALRKIPEAVARGEFPADPLPKIISTREFSELEEALHKMSSSLRQSAVEVEKWAEKTAGDLTFVNTELKVLATALEHAGESVEIADPQGRYVFVNPAFEALTGYTAKEVMGRRADELFGVDESLDRLLATVPGPSGERIFRDTGVGTRKNGTQFEQAVTLAGISTPEQGLKYVVGIRRDITELKHTQEALRVRDHLASVGTLAAGVAHEINNPLTYVIANLSYAVNIMSEIGQVQELVPDAVDFEDALVEACEGAERVKSIVQDLKTFARSDTEAISVLDVNNVLESALKLVANEIRYSAKLTLSLESVGAVLGNESKLSQVFINLLVNAVQALPEGNALENEIHIITRNESDNVVVEISDTGCGMSNETLRHAFDPFFTTKQVGVGTGLGLCICHNIIASIGGEIHLESRPGNGTRVLVSLPIANMDAIGDIATVSAPRDSDPLDRFRVLVIDDEPAVGKAFRRILKDCRVDLSTGGAEGMKRIGEGDYDVIFCDLMMPDLSGMDLYAQIEEQAPDKAEDIVFMTGGVFTPAAEAFVQDGNRLVLHKPFDSEQIRRLVADRKKPPRPRTVSEIPAAIPSISLR